MALRPLSVFTLNTSPMLPLPLTNKMQQQEIAHEATNVSGVSRVTLSIGLASCGVNKSPKYTAFINQADSAMYRAKKQGRNQICLHDKEDNLSYLT